MPHELNPGLEYAQHVYDETAVLTKAVARAAYPDRADANPLEVFDPPYPVRSAAPDPGYSPAVETNVRAEFEKLGPGRTENMLPSDLGLPGKKRHLAVAPGKIGGKSESECEVINEELAANPNHTASTAIVVLGSIERTLAGGKNPDPDEVAATLRYGLTPGESTEYEGVVAAAANRLQGFEPIEPPVALPFSYHVTKNNSSPNPNAVTCEVNDERSGLVQLVGRVAGQPVIGFGIDTAPKVKPDGSIEHVPPDTADMLGLVDTMLKNAHVAQEAGFVDDGTTPIALVESATYLPSRKVDAARAAITAARPIGVAVYGTETFASVKQRSAAPPAINQIPGEAYRAAEQAEELRKVIEAAR